MDAAFMLFQRRGWGIHVVSREPERAGDQTMRSMMVALAMPPPSHMVCRPY